MAKITVVDEKDTVIGSEERSVVREKGLRHRIVRVFVVNSDRLILLQRRNPALKDNPHKWDQSVGGHVDEGEDYLMAAQRETREELGIDIDEFTEIGKFYIERPAPGGLVRRFQTVFTCRWNGEVTFDEHEVAEVGWFTVDQVSAWLQSAPDDFTKNFAIAFKLLKQDFKGDK